MIPTEACGLDQRTQRLLLGVFQKYPKIIKVILYGSRAKGNFKLGSDIDLTVDAPQMELSELLKIENELDDLLLPHKIDLSLLHHIDNQGLLDHIKRVGIVL